MLALLLAAAGPLAPGRACANGIRFLVAEPAGQVVHGDSYVITLDQPADIAHARALIAQGLAAGSPILVARIAKGADGINRDVLAPGAPPWSWHVTQFLGFADVVIELYDGWPGYVEQDVDGWMANTGGMIGFWHYTVTHELGPVPEPPTAGLLGAGLAGLVLMASFGVRKGERPRLAARHRRGA